jgi:peroxisome-assembly ATPase
MRAPCRILAPRLPHRPPSLSIGRRACISSISSPLNSHHYLNSRPNSSLAVNSGLNNIENILSNGSANAPSNLQDRKHCFPFSRCTLSHLCTSDALTPLRQYQKLIDSGVLRGDHNQTQIIQKLQDLHDELANYDPPMIPYPSSENSLVSLLILFVRLD